MAQVIIGDRSRLAVEYELNEEYGGVWLFGKFCLWIKGQQIGDYDMGVSLRDILILIESIVRDNANRAHSSLFELSTNELYVKLNNALYGSSEDEIVANEETWARFDVNLTIDIFNCWKMFLVEDSEGARLVFRQLLDDDYGDIDQIELRKGEFDEVIYHTYEELGRIYDIEKAKII